ncbi:hypothetical protein [Lysobacter gummosus]|uniref:hypothetical protein n=1 Tax=Lysobacter gummosus TaxID=262324 RepID=UPI003628E599
MDQHRHSIVGQHFVGRIAAIGCDAPIQSTPWLGRHAIDLHRSGLHRHMLGHWVGAAG